MYEQYAPIEKLAPLVREIGWSHNLIILERCQDSLQREFHIRMTKKFGWSKSVLIHQIENQSYELYEQLDTLEETNTKLKAARDLLLPRLMRGEIGV